MARNLVEGGRIRKGLSGKITFEQNPECWEWASLVKPREGSIAGHQLNSGHSIQLVVFNF